MEERKNKVRRFITEIKVNPMIASKLIETLSINYEVEVYDPDINKFDPRKTMVEEADARTIIKVYEVY